MSTPTTAMTSSTGGASNRQLFERLWRTSGIQFIACVLLAYAIYGQQPQIGASPDELVAFYDGGRCGSSSRRCSADWGSST